MNILVCGSRDFGDEGKGWLHERNWIYDYLSGLYQAHDVGWNLTHLSSFIIIEGGATGADTIAREWAINYPLHGPYVNYQELVDNPDIYLNGQVTPVSYREFPANWYNHETNGCDGHCKGGGYCSWAGPVRNSRMLFDGKPDVVLAFINKPIGQSRGTRDMVQQSKGAHIKTITVEVPPS